MLAQRGKSPHKLVDRANRLLAELDATVEEVTRLLASHPENQDHEQSKVTTAA